jgi:hypothetical protein
VAKRSVAITLVNNLPASFTITHFWEAICHGSWGPVTATPATDSTTADPNSTLPAGIASNEILTWSSADSEFSIGKGTEAWVKYTVEGPDYDVPSEPGQPAPSYGELLFLHWNNEYDPSSSEIPLVAEMRLSEVNSSTPGGVPCEQGEQTTPWPQFGVTPSPRRMTQVIMVSNSGPNSPPTFSWGSSGAGPAFDVFLGWPFLLGDALVDLERDVNWSFTLVLREVGSVAQSIRHLHDGKQGLRALAVQAHQPSLRKLLAL